MKALLSLLRMDCILVFRDKIVLYMVLAPALLALAMGAFTGGAGGVIPFCVDKAVPEAVRTALAAMADVQRADGYDGVRARVERQDSAAGVFMRNGMPTLLLEGNEPEAFAGQAETLLRRAASGSLPAFESRTVPTAGGMAAAITAAMLLMMSVFIGGAAAGFHIVAEREAGAVRALAVSPLAPGAYLVERTAFAVLLALLNTAVCALLLGRGGRLLPLLAAAAASAPVCALAALALGATAQNQIAAISTLKLLMPAALALPLSSIFVPEGLRFLYWWLPVYWQYESLAAALGGRPWAAQAALAFATGFVWILALFKPAVRRFGLRSIEKGG